MTTTNSSPKLHQENSNAIWVSHLPSLNHLRRQLRVFAPLMLLLITAAFATGCFESKIITTKLDDPKQNPKKSMNGVFYALPRTIVKVDVPIVKTEIKDAFYKQYAPCFFPKEKVLDTATEFEIDAANIKFEKLSVADPEHVYLIKTQGGMWETRNLEMSLTESGVFVKGVAESENQSLDLLTSTIKDVVGIASKAVVGPAHLSGGIKSKQIQTFREKLTPAQDKCYMEKVDELDAAEADLGLDKESLQTALKVQLSDNLQQLFEDEKRKKEADSRKHLATLVIGAPAHANLQQRLTRLENARQQVTEFEQAKAVYDRIVELEEKRDTLLGGSGFGTPLSNETFTKMLGELDATIKAYKAKYFLGTKKQTPTVIAFRMDPTSIAAPNTKNLFQFSTTDGVCLPLTASNQGVRVDPDFASAAACAGPQPVRLIVTAGDNGEGDVGPVANTMSGAIGAAALDQSGKRGFYYRVPGRGVASLVVSSMPQLELARETMSIAQFGKTVSLPASTGGRRTKYTIELFEASGGLKNFIMGSDALVKQSNVKDLTDSASTIVEATGERKEARRKANLPPDELNELERKRKILEEKKKIQDLEKALGTQGTGPESNP